MAFGPPGGRSSRRFVAAYYGECAECGDEIWEGDEVGYLDDEVCCSNCLDKEITT